MSRQTRADKAMELLRLASNGPSFDLGFPGPQQSNPAIYKAATEEAIRTYQGWARSWVLPLLSDLVPELKGAEQIAESIERIAESIERIGRATAKERT